MGKRLLVSVLLSISLIASAISACAAAPTPNTGLTPKEVYILKQKALETLDFNEFGKYVTKDNAEGIKQTQDIKKTMFLIKTLTTPTEFTVEKEEINGNSAVIYLKGKYPLDRTKPENPEPGFGKAMFKKEGTAWKFQIEKWQRDPWK
ncbi:MAG: hypothetical protein AB2L14_18270 [Candidatus Xenobiia bacterium LiM19]